MMRLPSSIASVITFLALLCLCLLPAGPLRAEFPPIAGDLNDDGFVGLADLDIVLDHWNQNVTPGDWSQGDPSGDGFVGLADLDIVLGNWNAGYVPKQPFNEMSKGINLHEVKEWTREWPFVDVMKTVQRWIPTNPNGQPFELQSGDPNFFVVAIDLNGWPILQPGQAVHAVMFKGNGGFYPASTVENPHYVVTFEVTFDGPGGYSDVSLAFDFDAGSTETVVSDGRMTFEVATPTNYGVVMRIANNHATSAVTVHNVKVWMPGFENAASPFHPTFIYRLRPFSVIRFMDWQRTNTVDEVIWNDQTTDRATRAYFSQATGKGVALEYMIELCNELDADPWFCMPHKADNLQNGYVESFAKMVRDGDPANNIPPLHADAKIYIEWSNEVWNDRPGDTDVYDGIESETGHGLGADEFYNKWANEAAADFKTWYDTFAATDQENRLIRVAAGQAGNVDVTEKLTRRLKDRTDFAEQFDAVSCAAYFGDNHATIDVNTSVEDILYDMLGDPTANPPVVGRAMAESIGFYQNHGKGDGAPNGLAQQLSDHMGRNIPFIAYEGGQHYIKGGVYPNIKEAQRDARIYDAVFENLTAFKAAGGTLFMAFNYANDQDNNKGAWGHLDHQDQPIEDAHKFRATLDFPNHE